MHTFFSTTAPPKFNVLDNEKLYFKSCKFLHLLICLHKYTSAWSNIVDWLSFSTILSLFVTTCAVKKNGKIDI